MEITASVLGAQRSLGGMQARQLEALAETAAEVLFPAGHRIFADGDRADKFWLIQSGRVVLDVHVPGEGPVIIGRVGIGGLLGWSWLVPPHEWACGAVCATEVRALEFNALAVRMRCASDPALGEELTRRMLQVAAARLRDTKARLLSRPAA